MSTSCITLRCACGFYVRVVDVYPGQTVEIARTFQAHPCKETSHD